MFRYYALHGYTSVFREDHSEPTLADTRFLQKVGEDAREHPLIRMHALFNTALQTWERGDREGAKAIYRQARALKTTRKQRAWLVMDPSGQESNAGILYDKERGDLYVNLAILDDGQGGTLPHREGHTKPARRALDEKKKAKEQQQQQQQHAREHQGKLQEQAANHQANHQAMATEHARRLRSAEAELLSASISEASGTAAASSAASASSAAYYFELPGFVPPEVGLEGAMKWLFVLLLCLGWWIRKWRGCGNGFGFWGSGDGDATGGGHRRGGRRRGGRGGGGGGGNDDEKELRRQRDVLERDRRSVAQERSALKRERERIRRRRDVVDSSPPPGYFD